ncbi:hypothetical protein ACLKA6_012795 [Drosophila palustris]
MPKVENIQPILDRLNGLEGVANGYTTKCTQNGAIRLLCNSMDVNNKISQELHNNNAELLRINCVKIVASALLYAIYTPPQSPSGYTSSSLLTNACQDSYTEKKIRDI